MTGGLQACDQLPACGPLPAWPLAHPLRACGPTGLRRILPDSPLRARARCGQRRVGFGNPCLRGHSRRSLCQRVTLAAAGTGTQLATGVGRWSAALSRRCRRTSAICRYGRPPRCWDPRAPLHWNPTAVPPWDPRGCGTHPSPAQRRPQPARAAHWRPPSQACAAHCTVSSEAAHPPRHQRLHSRNGRCPRRPQRHSARRGRVRTVARPSGGSQLAEPPATRRLLSGPSSPRRDRRRRRQGGSPRASGPGTSGRERVASFTLRVLALGHLLGVLVLRTLLTRNEWGIVAVERRVGHCHPCVGVAFTHASAL